MAITVTEQRRITHAYMARRNRSILAEAKKKPCADCGKRYHPIIMEFDHVRGVKKYNLGTAYGHRTIKKLQSELAKCDVVCANCHKLRSWRRGQFSGGINAND